MATAIGAKFGVTVYPTPVFNTPDVASCFGGTDGDSLPFDHINLNRTIETVLLKGTKVQLLEQIEDGTEDHIWKVQTREYPYPGNFYIDDRFVMRTINAPKDRVSVVSSIPALIKKLNAMEHCRYIWGGNWPQGVDLLAKLYPSQTPLSKLTPLIQDSWKLKGMDCTGLPYYMTDGYSPRNSSALVRFGCPVPIENLDAVSIIDRLQALDFIVWEGHLVWVLDENCTIESRHPIGLVKCNLFDRLKEILKERKPVDDYSRGTEDRFVVRRWHPENTPRRG